MIKKKKKVLSVTAISHGNKKCEAETSGFFRLELCVYSRTVKRKTMFSSDLMVRPHSERATSADWRTVLSSANKMILYV